MIGLNRFSVRVRRGLGTIAFVSAAMLCMSGAEALAQAAAQAPAQSAQTPAQPAAANTAELDAARVVEFLNQTIAWYRQIAAQQQLVANANDDVYVSADRQLAIQVVRLAFQFARAAASVQQAPGQAAAVPAYERAMQQEAEALKDEKQVVSEVEDLRKQIATASGQQKQMLEAQLAETQAEVDFAAARVDAIRSFTRFLNGAGNGATGLNAQIDALESSLPPEVRQTAGSGMANGSASGGMGASTSQQQEAPATPSALIAIAGSRSGLWESATGLVVSLGKLRSINTAVQQTQDLSQSAQAIRGPLIATLRDLTRRSDELAHQADSANTATLGQEKQQLDAATQEFKQLTGSAIPLAQVGILLGLYQKNLANWQAGVVSEAWTQTQGFAARLTFLALIIALVLGASELWRRAITKYVRDARRRWTLHWVRKLVIWGAIAAIVTFSLVSEIGSLATFAGLITAGVAVSLQNVIQSVVGYFFLIGKYGIRAGDRVMIGGVSGEVIDVGLVRIHLMEMGGAGGDTPTGRVVAFSNSIVFNGTPGLFKQIPGTSFAWHEINLTLPAGTNFSTARARLMSAVEAGLADFKDEIAKQHSAIEHAFEATPGMGLRPTVQLHFTSSGLEAVVRYPVALRHAMEIDERVTHAILTDADLTHAGSPAIRLETATAS